MRIADVIAEVFPHDSSLSCTPHSIGTSLQDPIKAIVHQDVVPECQGLSDWVWRLVGMLIAAISFGPGLASFSLSWLVSAVNWFDCLVFDVRLYLVQMQVELRIRYSVLSPEM